MGGGAYPCLSLRLIHIYKVESVAFCQRGFSHFAGFMCHLLSAGQACETTDDKWHINLVKWEKPHWQKVTEPPLYMCVVLIYSHLRWTLIVSSVECPLAQLRSPWTYEWTLGFLSNQNFLSPLGAIFPWALWFPLFQLFKRGPVYCLFLQASLPCCWAGSILLTLKVYHLSNSLLSFVFFCEYPDLFPRRFPLYLALCLNV